MDEIDNSTFHDNSAIDSEDSDLVTRVRSLKELIDQVSGKNISPSNVIEDIGLADIVPFPLLAFVGQEEMKLALILAMINPNIGGVLLIGTQGTGKTLAVRSLIDLLPEISRSACHYGCLPDDIETLGIDAVCPDCARKYAEGESLTFLDRIRIIELPLSATQNDLFGSFDEEAQTQKRWRLKKGLLAQADRNILYVDEVNLLSKDILDILLGAASQGQYTVRRGSANAVFHSRFTLIGSMDPEEGELRPQILDRFGLRVVVRSLENLQERLEAYQRIHNYLKNPRQLKSHFAKSTAILRSEIKNAREFLPKVVLPEDIALIGIRLIKQLGIDSLRAEINLFEAARANAAKNGREEVNSIDINEVAMMALRLRKSNYSSEYNSRIFKEESVIKKILATM